MEKSKFDVGETGDGVSVDVSIPPSSISALVARAPENMTLFNRYNYWNIYYKGSHYKFRQYISQYTTLYEKVGPDERE